MSGGDPVGIENTRKDPRNSYPISTKPKQKRITYSKGRKFLPLTPDGQWLLTVAKYSTALNRPRVTLLGTLIPCQASAEKEQCSKSA